jgi:hypothetical protein
MAAGSDASGFATTAEAIESMAGSRSGDPQRRSRVFEPNAQNERAYQLAYKDYRELARSLGR